MGSVESSVPASLDTFTRTVTVEVPMPVVGIQLEVRDDTVALEDDERLEMTLTVVETSCSVVETTPYPQATIIVSDDDGKSIL